MASSSTRRQKTASSNDLKGTYLLEDLNLLAPQSSFEALQKDAIRAINQELARTDELHIAVPRLLQACDNELLEVRKSIHAIVSTQTGEACRSRRVLKEASEKIVKLQGAFVEQGDILSGMQTAACYRQLKQLTVLRANVQRIIKWTEALKAIHHFPIDKSLRSGKFLENYQRLRETQDIRASVMSKAASDPRASDVFEPYFFKLDSHLEIFIMHVKSVFEGSTMIAILHVLGDDEENDVPEETDDDDDEGNPIRKFSHLEECVEICCREMVNPCMHKRYGDDADIVLDTNGVAKWVTESVSATWVDEVMGDVTDPNTQLTEYLSAMKKLEQILVALEMALAPLSTKFPFFSLVVVAFHAEVMVVARNYAESGLAATDLLEVIEFMRWYHNFLDENSFMVYLNTGTGDIEGSIGDLMKLAVDGMSDHLMTQSTNTATTTCELSPDKALIVTNGKYLSCGPPDLFTMLYQSLGNITATAETQVSQKLAKACADGVQKYMNDCMKKMDYDYWEDTKQHLKSKDDPATEWTSIRLEYLYAFCNDLTDIRDKLKDLEEKFANVWASDIDETPFQKLESDIADNVRFYVDEIGAHVNSIVSDAWKQLFVSTNWQSADSNPLRVILDDTADFIDEEFPVTIYDEHAKELSKALMMNSFRRYLTELFSYFSKTQDSKWKSSDAEIFHSALARDASELHSFWKPRTTSTRLQLVDQGRQAIDVLADLIRYTDATKVDFFERVLRGRLLENFGDCPSFVVNYIIEKRADVDSKVKTRLKHIWSDLTKTQKRGDDDVAPGWKQGTTFLGGISRDLAPESRGFFGKKTKPKELESAARIRVKEEKRKAREEEEQANKLKMKSAAQLPQGRSTDVERQDIKDLFG